MTHMVFHMRNGIANKPFACARPYMRLQALLLVKGMART